MRADHADQTTPIPGRTSGIETVNLPTAESICQLAYFDVGPRHSDEAREAAITRAARAMEHHMAEVAAINARDPHIFSDFADAAAARWKAQWARQSMEKLIAGRSADQIARMERERGLA